MSVTSSLLAVAVLAASATAFADSSTGARAHLARTMGDKAVGVDVEVTEVAVPVEHVRLIQAMNERMKADYQRSSARMTGDAVPMAELTGISFEKLVKIGEKAWELVKENRPVVNTTTKRLSVLPEGLQDWRKMSDWKDPVAKTFKFEIKNVFGQVLVAQKYTVVSTYGGGIRGKGKYLANVTVLPDVYSFWFWNVNAVVETGDVVNMGSEDDPVAGLDLQIHWIAKSAMFQHFEAREAFMVKGDGNILQVPR